MAEIFQMNLDDLEKNYKLMEDSSSLFNKISDMIN
jgi:hypothetical protein